jgi:hypothetical protein
MRLTEFNVELVCRRLKIVRRRKGFCVRSEKERWKFPHIFQTGSLMITEMRLQGRGEGFIEENPENNGRNKETI